MREMAPGANGFSNNSYFVFFCAPRCHLTDGCHLTHTGAIIQLNDFIQDFARHPRCHLSDGCDAELVNTTHGNAAADRRQPGAISPVGRYHDGTVKDLVVHTIWWVKHPPT